MTDLDAVPLGTIVRPLAWTYTYERIRDGWVQISAWGERTVVETLPPGPADVVLIPAEWLRDRLTALAESFERQWPDTPAAAEDAIRELAIDAGLS